MSPGRRILFLITMALGLACLGLSGWQLSRLIDRRSRNKQALAQRDLPTVDLNRTALSGIVSYRRVTGRGQYDFSREIVLRGRLLSGGPGIHVITPLRLTGRDTAVLVNRGFVPTPDAGPIADSSGYREAESTEVGGIAAAVPDAGDGVPLATARGESWRRLDLTALRNRLPYPIAPYYIIVAPLPSSADHTLRGHSLPVRVDPPPLDD